MASRPAEDDFDDEISLTSTDDENGGPEDELFVTKILAEREVNGEAVCLIQWQDLPLAEATWEPRENLTDDLKAEWVRTREDQRNGLIPKFSIQEWKDASLQNYQSSLARHLRRNLVRAKRGYPQTAWTKTLHQLLNDLAAYSNDEDEIDRAHKSPTEKGLHQSVSHDDASSPTNHPEEGFSEPSTELLVNSPQALVQEKLSGTPDGRRTVSTSEKLSLDHPADLTSTSDDVGITSRRLVEDPVQSSEASHEVPTRPSLSHRTPTGGSGRYTNIFAGGRTRKGRGTLSEAASNPETNPKFLNSHLQRKIELQRRNKEGIIPPAHRPPALISLDHINSQVTPSEQPAFKNAIDDARASEKSKPKNRCFVHWEDEPMEMDPNDSLFVSDELASPTPNASDVAAAQVDNRVSEKQSITPMASKTVQLGPDGQNTVTLSFNGIPPPETGLKWAAQFCSDERLIFTHTCTAYDFLSQTSTEGGFSVERLCRGTVLSFTENNVLKNLAENLRLGSLGLLCRNDCYYVLLTSVKSHNQMTQDLEKVTLEYTIFEPVGSLGPFMLAPAPQLRISGKRDRHSAFYARPLDQIFGQKYEQLLPSDAKNAEKHNFFLAFPPRAGEEAALLSRWLRSYRVDSDIRTSYFAGHWSSFSKLPHGVVIIHEDALWFIRLFPKLGALLHGRKTSFNFWVFNRSLMPVPPFVSEDLPASPLGDVHLLRVFDPGAAYLITPSFIVSEPEQAYTFLKWFWNNYVRNADMNRPRKLVLCAKVDEWMHNLSLEKVILRKKYPDTASEDELKAMGLCNKAMECRQKTFKLFQQLVADATSEITNSIVLAPESIDGNDEQSLVNWFGYWSILHVGQFRRYTVIGSGWQTEVRLSRILRTPNYTKSIVTDPDELQSDPPGQPEPSSATSSSAPRSNREYESFSIAYRLSELVKGPRRDWCPLMLYWFPVAYSTSDVAFRLGDITSKYHTYEKWFNYFWKEFETISKNKHCRNSIAGLFYTLDENQAPSYALNNAQRSPWVAVFRASNPHIRPWKSSELFIWDLRYSESINEGKEFCHSDLLEAQQRLIEHVREKTRDLLPLEKVWAGAFGAKADGTAALDVTIQWLDTVLGKVRDWLPAPAMEVPKRGWSLVTPQRQLGDQEGKSVIINVDAMKVNLMSEDDTSPKIIFHPPRGNGQKPFTKCRNRLYQWTRKADPKLEGRNFEYLFRQTMDWYNEQCEEGRGFEHIKVSPWRDIFQAYKVEEFLQHRG
ncbi:hypothetical protein V8C37DRAFT_390964 [Trichoderma ceciliae]